ncbi:hypothetical protein [Duncaniella freteri]|uniref:hypothetical protein n=1 Tax=Duncaniella freteri TaxID=2530391 RepID=UPI00256EF72C|nr:hypothetical protein [Duncaniella freteri]
MKKSKKLSICNWSLIILTIIITISSIQLESTHSQDEQWIWFHIVAGTMFVTAIIWHLYLHFNWKSWIKCLHKQKSLSTRWLAAFGALTFLSAVATLVHWFATYTHSPIGGIHGKFGFVFLILSIFHTTRRIKFFKTSISFS